MIEVLYVSLSHVNIHLEWTIVQFLQKTKLTLEKLNILFKATK